MTESLKGRSAIITGASQGLGLEIARAYVRAGANVLICARDANVLDPAYAELRDLAKKDQIVAAEAADVTRPADAARLVDRAVSLFSSIQVLVNNAGVLGPLGAVDEVDWAEWVRTIEINLNGSVLMCRAVLPYFRSQRYGKIVQLSGGGATSPMPRMSAYAASKAAIVRFAETLAHEVREFNVDVNALAPGALNTRMLDEVLAAGPDRVGQSYYDRMARMKDTGGAPLSAGAALAVFFGSAASDGISGRLLSAVWDPWETTPEHRADIESTDIYTLRRIVPRDRGFGWGDR